MNNEGIDVLAYLVFGTGTWKLGMGLGISAFHFISLAKHWFAIFHGDGCLLSLFLSLYYHSISLYLYVYVN